MDKNLSSSSYQISDKVNFGGLLEPPQVKELAKKIMDLYDSNKDGFLEQADIGCIMSDAYRATNRGFNPSQNDIQSGQKIIDRKGNGKISLDDLEFLVNKYFVGAPPAEPVKRIPEKLSKTAMERLEVARRIFRKIDVSQVGYLTEKEVPDLLKETYKQMGMNYEPTHEDVVIWIEMADSDGDGQVTLSDYEQLVLKSLRTQGISLE